MKVDVESQYEDFKSGIGGCYFGIDLDITFFLKNVIKFVLNKIYI